MNTIVSSYRSLPKNTHVPLTVPMDYLSGSLPLLALLVGVVWMFSLGYYVSHTVTFGF